MDAFCSHGYVSLAGDEPRTLRRLGLPVVQTPEGPFLGTREDEAGRSVCAALAGAVGLWCSCSVYPERPGKCERFEAGGVACLAARRELGLAG